MDYTPEEAASPDPSSHIDQTRRRRTRRALIPTGKTERAIFLNEIARRLMPGLEFYLLSALCGIVLGAAILVDHPAMYLFAALVSPFMAPLVGLAFSTAIGSLSFFIQSMGGLAIGAGFVFVFGALAGWISRLLPSFTGNQAAFFTSFSIPLLVILVVGTALTIFQTVHAPKQRALAGSAALASAFYLPVGVAGFALTSVTNAWLIPALQTAGTALVLVMLSGFVVLLFMRLRPTKLFGYLLTLLLFAGVISAFFMSGGVQKAIQPLNTVTTQRTVTDPQTTFTETPAPPTATIPVPVQATATNTLVPTRTPTVTITPKPPSVYATIDEPMGVYMMESACSTCAYVGLALENNTPVEVLGYSEDGIWAKIRVADGREGWLAKRYLNLAPAR